MIHAIFFDLDGTLFHRAEAHRRYSLDLINRRPDVFLDARREADLEFLTEAADDPAWNRRAFARRVAERYPALGMTHAELARDLAVEAATDPVKVDAWTALVGGKPVGIMELRNFMCRWPINAAWRSFPTVQVRFKGQNWQCSALGSFAPERSSRVNSESQNPIPASSEWRSNGRNAGRTKPFSWAMIRPSISRARRA